MSDKNKNKVGLRKLHVANPIKIEGGEINYEKAFKIPGVVNLS